MEVRGESRMRDEQLLLLIGDALDREPDCRHRDVQDQIDLVDIVPAPRDAAADVGLELVIADHDTDRLAQHLAAEIVDRHLRRRHRTLAGRRRGRAVHVGKHADLHDVVGNLRERRRRCEHRCRAERSCGKRPGKHPFTPWSTGALAASFVPSGGSIALIGPICNYLGIRHSTHTGIGRGAASVPQPGMPPLGPIRLPRAVFGSVFPARFRA